jgi:prophage regulatory protein
MTNPVSFKRRKEVTRQTGLPRSTLQREIDAGRFPAPVKLTGGRSVGWLSSSVDQWMADRIAASATV